MATVIEILERLEADNSRNFKEEFLEIHSANELLKRVFAVAGDPYINFYVNKFKMPPVGTASDDDDVVIDQFLDFIVDYLSTRKITGNAAKDAIIALFSNLSSLQQKWCLRILLKNLRCGVQETTVNKIWAGSIKKFSVQLADTLETHHDPMMGLQIKDRIDYPVRVEPKLDGLRCIVVKTNSKVTLFTRSGSVLETLPRIKSILEKADYDNFVLDGEIMGSDWNESASVVMSHKKSKDDSNMIFHVFDSMSFEEWQDQNCRTSLRDRIISTEKLIKKISSKSVVMVSGESANNHSELLEFYSKKMESGYEGIMVKKLESTYTFKRSDSVLKLKPVTTYEGVVVGNYLGARGSKREGLWAGFEIVLPNGVVTRVGGGFTDKIKAEIGMNPETWLGRVIEVEGQPDPATKNGLTKDGRIRFPVFIRERSRQDVDPSVLIAGEKLFNKNVEQIV